MRVKILSLMLALVMVITSIGPVYANEGESETSSIATFSTTDGAVMFEAEAATLHENYTDLVTGDATIVSGGKAVQLTNEPDGNIQFHATTYNTADKDLSPFGGTSTGNPIADVEGGINFNMVPDKAGTYYVWVRFLWNSSGTATAWSSVNNIKYKFETVSKSASSKYLWVKLTYASGIVVTEDTIGQQVNMRFRGCKPGVVWDKFLITTDAAFEPKEMNPYVAQISGKLYETLQEAISAASAGETIKVVGNVALTDGVTSSANITINSGVTLDLNGFTLNMGDNYLYSYGDVVDSSTNKAGRLMVATYDEGELDKVPEGTPKGTLAPTNSQVPIYIAEEGSYMFATMKGQGNVTEATADDFTVDFRPSFGSAYSILAGGADAAKLEFIVRLDWSAGGKNYYQLFKCGNDLVKTIYGQGKKFIVTFNGLTGYKAGMKVTVLVKSDLGVESLNNEHTMKITSIE